MMPTGYTDKVMTGEVADFPTFAMLCARAFGATIEMRDDPLSKEIPAEFKPSDWHADRIVAARKRLSELEAMTSAEIVAARDFEAAEKAKRHEDQKAKTKAMRARYEDMIEKVRQWPPRRRTMSR